jgi:hypothetical protein
VGRPLGTTEPKRPAAVLLMVGTPAATTVGGAMYVKRSDELVELVPPAVVTVTSTIPVPGGEVAVI